jgi:hypothetical protein
VAFGSRLINICVNSYCLRPTTCASRLIVTVIYNKLESWSGACVGSEVVSYKVTDVLFLTLAFSRFFEACQDGYGRNSCVWRGETTPHAPRPDPVRKLAAVMHWYCF